MKKDILKGIIRDFHVGPLAELLTRDIDVPLSSGKIISLIGVRRSGKTSVLLNSIGKLKNQGLDLKKVLYLNFEDERLDLKTDELDLILQAYRELYPDLDLKDCYFSSMKSRMWKTGKSLSDESTIRQQRISSSPAPIRDF